MTYSGGWLANAAISVIVVGAGAVLETPQKSDTSFPPRLQSYLTHIVRPSAEDRRRLLGGAPITKLLDADATKEVAVFGAIWIDAPIRRYVEAVQDIENFERGGAFLATRRIGAVPRLEDFADMHLPEDDVSDLRTCRIGDCEVKLSADALQRFRTQIDWNSKSVREQADALMRRLSFEYVNGYLEGGDDRLAVYRDKSRPRFVAEEFRAMTAEMPELTSYLPEVRRYLLGYPKVSLPRSTSFLYWQSAKFGLKPTIRISHVTIREAPHETVSASKMLYASHYFWTGLELRVLVPDASRGPGFWFVTISRSRSDGLSGFTGMFVRGRVRGEVQKGTLTALNGTKRRLERAR